AYDWNALVKNKIIEDSVADVPLLLTMSKDERSFYALNRNTYNGILHFSFDSSKQVLVDDKTNSTWSISGSCIDGTMKGDKLQVVQSYQEFWHSWQSFHPNTEIYK
ncbi:MAG: DUF3179 domain-containing (seleno)protein, partial [Parafilimonas sp.]